MGAVEGSRSDRIFGILCGNTCQAFIFSILWLFWIPVLIVF